MGNNGFENFCNCENNESKLEASFRTSPNQNNPSSDRIYVLLFIQLFTKIIH